MQIYFDLRELRTFTLLAQDLNFTSVAERQNTVQSAISAQLKKLEHAVGQRLVSRGRGQRVALTAEGAAFLVYAQRILALSEEAVETARTANAHHVLRLGTTVTLSMSIVAKALARFAKDWPDTQIQIQCDRSDGLLARLETGDIDVAFMMDQGRHSLRRFVHSMPLCWVASPAFSMPADGPVPLAFLTDGRDLRRYALGALDGAGLAGRVSHLSPHPVGVRTLVQAGLAVTVMPERTVVSPLSVAPADLGLPPLASIALSAYQAAGDKPLSHRAFIDELSRFSA